MIKIKLKYSSVVLIVLILINTISIVGIRLNIVDFIFTPMYLVVNSFLMSIGGLVGIFLHWNISYEDFYILKNKTIYQRIYSKFMHLYGIFGIFLVHLIVKYCIFLHPVINYLINNIKY